MLARLAFALAATSLTIVAVLWMRVLPREAESTTDDFQRALTIPHNPVLAGGGALPAQAMPAKPPAGYRETAIAIGQGAQLFKTYNCVGCHHQGGGGIGRALMDDAWRYGSSPEQIYETIVAGRPDGMPAFGGRLTNEQVWALTAYVRTLGRLVPMTQRPSRDDHMRATAPMTLQEPKWPAGSMPGRLLPEWAR